jgi:GalNAc-alpha-(1->4)-GalNAc-alpha-(1->3)-diNAcBac-PP-undecaprenol alpha-1,4-N-acetyl-D-galactosaminyltransferase
MTKKQLYFVIHSLQAGGMERVMSELICYFAAQTNYEVHLVLYGIKRDVFYQIPNNITIHRPGFAFNNKARLWSTVKTLFFLRKTLKGSGAHSILSFGERWNNLVLLSTLGLSLPIYVSDRAQPDKPLGAKDDTLRKWLYPKAKGIIVQTEKALAIFSKMYGHSNFKIIGNPIRKIADRGLPREKVILMVGRLIQSKNQNRLIDIFSKLDAPDWKLVLVGYDHLQQENQKNWEQLAKNLGVADRVIFAGKQSDVEQFYLTASIFAYTSVSEGFPNVVGEAMSAGLPIVAYDCIAGPSDLVTNEQNGYLIPLQDEHMFLEKLQLLVNQEELRVKQGIKSKELIRAFELEMICRQYDRFLVDNK